VATEKYIGLFHHLYSMNCTILRLSNLYGRKVLTTRQLGAVDIFLDQFKKGKTIEIWGDGENVRDYLHIKDAVDFLMLIVEKDEISGIFNVGTGIGTSLNGILKIIGKIVKRKISVKYSRSRNFDVRRNILDISKAKKTGWKPRYSLYTGIKEILYG
jgi:UDP-glucose 4-epimerase